jgi:hypothetical protein
MAKNVSPPRGSRGPTSGESFAANFSTTDLTARSGMPAFAPQRVVFRNNGTATQNAVYTLQSGTVKTVPIAPGGGIHVEDSPVDTITDTSGADVSCETSYWHGNSAPFNA